jgi:hypothetical protein
VYLAARFVGGTKVAKVVIRLAPAKADEKR